MLPMTSSSLSLLVAVSLLVPLSLIVRPTNAIVGGKIVEPPNRFPAFAWTGIRQAGWGCGGALIHEDIVLTAAHCQWVYYDSATVYVNPQSITGDGAANSTQRRSTKFDVLLTGEIHSVNNSLVHPDFQRTGVAGSYDVMLVKLTHRSLLTPFKYNTDHHIPTVGDKMTIVGFGTISERGNEGFSPVLRKVSVNAFNYQLCNATYASNTNDVDDTTQLCGGTIRGGKDACQSDSGCPLLVGNTVVGVVDEGVGCGRPNVPSINARVSGFANWIAGGICVLSQSPPTSCPKGLSWNESWTALTTPSVPAVSQQKDTGADQKQVIGGIIGWTAGGTVLLLGVIGILKRVHSRFEYDPIPSHEFTTINV